MPSLDYFLIEKPFKIISIIGKRYKVQWQDGDIGSDYFLISVVDKGKLLKSKKIQPKVYGIVKFLRKVNRGDYYAKNR